MRYSTPIRYLTQTALSPFALGAKSDANDTIWLLDVSVMVYGIMILSVLNPNSTDSDF